MAITEELRMKGVASAILAATPLAALILYFALSGQQQVRTDQQRVEVKQQIEAAQFDLEFEQMSRDISNKPMTAEELAKKKAVIEALKKKSETWDSRFDAEFEQMDKELAELKSALDKGQ
tara:strand:- start:6502 stop:6861 length:360 start_codon:yes stop_codon:yes gene_type:complete